MLTDLVIRKAIPKEKVQKLFDSHGLFLQVTKAGAKSWRFKFRFGGKEKLLTLGLYPDVKLAEAREKVSAARATLRAGGDPSKVKPVTGQAPSFETVARDWHHKNKARWSDRHADDVLKSLEGVIFGAIGSLAVDVVSVREVHSALKAIEKRGAIETAHRIRQRIDSIYSFAIASGLATNNPGATVRGALIPMAPNKRQPAIIDLVEARQMLKDALATPAQPITRLAVSLLVLTAVRPGELRHAEWSEFEIDSELPLWTIPAIRMKGEHSRKSGKPHLVPLSPEAVVCLRQLQPLTGTGKLVFPSIRHAHVPMSENAIGYLLNRAGYHGRQTAHGFRATFSTIMNEKYPADQFVVDLMLAHTPHSMSGSETAYNRSQHMERRRELAEAWAKLISP